MIYRTFLIGVATCAIVAAPSLPAAAIDFSHPGNACQGNSDIAVDSLVGIFNPTSSVQRVYCPIRRFLTFTPNNDGFDFDRISIRVFVFNANPPADVSCTLNVLNPHGTILYTGSATSAGANGMKQIDIAPGALIGSGDTATLICDLPPNVHGVTSLISYTVTETRWVD